MAAGRRPGGGRAGVVGMTVTAPDLIAGYLAELRAGLRVPPREAELILAEAEDHLRETAAVGLEVGMTELEAQQAAISSFGPVRAVLRAHRRRTLTAGDAALAAWKLTGLLAATFGAGGLATVFWLHFDPTWAPGVQVVTASTSLCQCSPSLGVPATSPAMMTLPCAAMAAGGLALLATRRLAARRLARRGASGWDPLSPAVTASFFLLVTALLFMLERERRGGGHRSPWLDHPGLGGHRHNDRSPRTWSHRRRVPGGCRRLRCPGGAQPAPRGPGSGALA